MRLGSCSVQVMLRRLVALRHAVERIERLESELRQQQEALAATRTEVEALNAAVARSDRIIAAMRERYARTATSYVRPASSIVPDHVVVASDLAPGSVPPAALIVMLDPPDELVPSWITTAAVRLGADPDVDLVVGDRVDVIGGRLLVTWAEAAAIVDPAFGADDPLVSPLSGPLSGMVIRGEVWGRAVATASADDSVGTVVRGLFTELAGADRIAAEGAVAAVAIPRPAVPVT